MVKLTYYRSTLASTITFSWASGIFTTRFWTLWPVLPIGPSLVTTLLHVACFHLTLGTLASLTHPKAPLNPGPAWSGAAGPLGPDVDISHRQIFHSSIQFQSADFSQKLIVLLLGTQSSRTKIPFRCTITARFALSVQRWREHHWSIVAERL